MPNIVVLPPDISAGRIYYGDEAGYEALPRMPEKTEEQRQAQEDANRAWVNRVAALQAERQAELDRNKLPFDEIPGAYKPVWRGNELAMEIDPKAIAAASAAVDAATQYQGIRGYQQALSEGRNPASAMSEFAPLIFAKKYPSSLARQTDDSTRVHNIGGVGYMRDPNNPAALIPVTPPKPQAQVETLNVGGTETSVIRQPSGALTVVKAPEDKQLKALESSKTAAEKALEDAQAKYTAATATRTEVTPPGTGLFGTGIMARSGSTNEVPLVVGKADEAEANLMAARARLNAANSNLTAYAQSKAAPQGKKKPLTKEAVAEAKRQANGDQAKARKILQDQNYDL